MTKIKLSDICNPKQWKTIPTSELLEEGYPVYGANGIIGYYSEFNHENPVVAVTCRGATCGSINITVPKAYVTGNAMCLDDVRSDIEMEYLYYCLKHYDFNNVISGSAQPQITRQGMDKIYITVCTHDEQISIVNKLKRVERVIELRKQELKSLDDLIKARFVELFGEGLKDDGRYPLLPVEAIGKVVSGATPKTSNEEFWDGDNLWITPAELSEESFIIYDSVRKITDEGVKSCAVNLLPVGTVILSSRAPIGKVAIAGAPMYCNQGFKNIIPNEKINTIYLYELLSMETEYLNSLGRGATFKEISKQIVENIKVKVPPIELQEQFADFVKQVDKSKFGD